MSDRNIIKAIPARINYLVNSSRYGFLFIASDVGEPGHANGKWSTGIRHMWTRTENTELIKCYYDSRPKARGYIQCMWELWMSRRPTSTLTRK